MTSEPVPPPAGAGGDVPRDDPPDDAGTGAPADVEPAESRPQTGAEGTAWRWWQVVVGVLGWVFAVVLMWYFGHAATALAWSLLLALVVIAVVVGFASAIFSVNVLRPGLVARRDRPLPLEHPRPLSHDALGRPVATPESAYRRATGELVAVTTPAGRQFLPPDQAAPYLAATLEGRHG